MSHERPAGKFPLNIDAERAPVDHDARSLREGSNFRDDHCWNLRPRETPIKQTSESTSAL